jgi:glutaconate CoA-transferase subunit A
VAGGGYNRPVPLHVLECGPAEAPSIVFLHGGGVGGWMWRPQLAALGGDYHCLVPDLPEHGQSRDEQPLSIFDAARRVAEIIKRRAHGGVAHVVGHSLGAQVAVALLGLAPSLVTRAFVSSALLRPLPLAGLIDVSLKLYRPFKDRDGMIRANMRSLGVPAEYYAEFAAGTRQPDVPASAGPHSADHADPRHGRRARAGHDAALGPPAGRVDAGGDRAPGRAARPQLEPERARPVQRHRARVARRPAAARRPARAAQQVKAMSKLTPLSDAIRQHVHDGDLIYCAGFTHLIPFAAGHEIIRQGRRGLTLARATPDIIYDQMVAAGCAAKLIFSYSGNPGVGSLRVVRAEIEAGRLAIEEYSHFAMITRLTAGAAGLPFLPMRSVGSEDLAHANPQYRTITDPYGGEVLNTVPALYPDVAIIHAQRADADGNTQIWGILGEQKEAAFAARRVIVTAEEIVDESVIRSDPNRTLIPAMKVDTVCHVPYAAHPSYTQGYYDRDNAFYLEWDKVSSSAGGVRAWLDEWVYGVPDRAAYWEKLSPAAHERLAVHPRWSEPVNYGDC